MVLELFLKAAFSLIDLLRGSFFLAIIAFVLVFLASFLHAWLSKKFKLSWLKATMLTSYLVIFILIILLYFLPVVSGWNASDQGVVPDFFKLSALQAASWIIALVARNVLIALMFAFFILPLEFFGSMVFDYMKAKFKLNKWISVFVGVFAASLAAAIICLFLLPWIVPGLVYITFYWHL